MAESIVTNCNFYGNFASLTGITITNTFPIEISSCLFSNHTTQGVLLTGGTSPNASKGSVIGCRFIESVPITEGGTDVVGRYAGNEGFAGSTILGPDSTVEGVRRYDKVAGTTTGSFVTLFTHKNQKGLTGIGTIKNTGATNTLTVQETATDVFGTTDTASTVVAALNDASFSTFANKGNARPPFVSYKIEVKHTVAATTFDIHFAMNGAE